MINLFNSVDTLIAINIGVLTETLFSWCFRNLRSSGISFLLESSFCFFIFSQINLQNTTAILCPMKNMIYVLLGVVWHIGLFDFIYRNPYITQFNIFDCTHLDPWQMTEAFNIFFVSLLPSSDTQPSCDYPSYIHYIKIFNPPFLLKYKD